jgi:hypothetical protein
MSLIDCIPMEQRVEVDVDDLVQNFEANLGDVVLQLLEVVGTVWLDEHVKSHVYQVANSSLKICKY